VTAIHSTHTNARAHTHTHTHTLNYTYELIWHLDVQNGELQKTDLTDNGKQNLQVKFIGYFRHNKRNTRILHVQFVICTS